MRLRYTPDAAAELDAVLTYIAERSPQGAHRAQQRIRAVIDLLLEQPHSGRLTSLRPMRRIVATPYPI
ncbi:MULTISPECIES: type II toxin-antitoxin system RelE/ParE family toxin [Methylorubrum]|uniref:type II toxin-antitoxin system RelE/ParE family toxin n=1 Tax=Methylorubrum TaxID=2282523 RepID=UPI0034613F72